MTLELARKRREQGDLIHEPAAALNNVWGLHHGLTHKGHLNRETCPATSCQEATAVLAKAKEHDCIPWDDAKEIAANQGHRW